MNKFWATFSLTYINKIKAKSFIIFMVLVAVLMIGLSNIDKIINMFDDGPDKIGVAAPNEQIYNAFKQQGKTFQSDIKYTKVSKDDAEKQVKNHKLDKAYVINLNKDNTLQATIISEKRVSKEDTQKVTALLTTIQTNFVATELNINKQDLQKLQAQSKVNNKIVSKDEVDKVSEGQKIFNYALAYGIIFLMFFIILNYASQIAMEIASEKTSRVIEMIITSISPVQHIFAKILGVIAVAVTQIMLIVMMAVVCIYAFDLKDLLKGFNVEMNQLSWQIIIIGIISSIVGIMAFVLLAAILGSLTSRIEDLNQSLMPLTLIGMIAFYIAIFTINNPDGKLAIITSYIPFFAPFQLVVRAQTSALQIHEVIISSLISIAMVAVLLWMAIKTYKDSVLTFERGLFKTFRRVFKQ
ncbi:ABC transporter permease [Staphylococcus schweitzeri]|uniref:ABC transporter permease n=1 Tax=Staphylococcus schweitzeri TaxID=1654388 RepID=A0A2K4AFV0_9STAP|nr:ABC transporter permease [Staphylococcus schweitzeri]MBE2129341.1 ABC transporter permease [Staphylococcus schweitzeri]PNZ48990.1 ABC transporter permease [Staphylococcus schweitzeri]CDR51212.1 Sodium export permease protein [Staphylococcus schweitzeri]CDR53841.1 Sodium export permease protein [Staphylococcus schweitzeri]CDR61006.1 Sodium export permease protein [Staphylococcus schweitzeri]